MPLPSQAGLGLLLYPISSNVVVKTASCSVRLVLPVYSTFKAIENKDTHEQHRWLLYWTAYGSFSAAEMFAEKVISWIPLYYHMKFAFLVWLQLPTITGKFISAHQEKLDFAKTLAVKAFLHLGRRLHWFSSISANQMIRDITRPVERKSNEIECSKRKRLVQDAESEGPE